MNYPARALNTTDERFGTERSTRADAYTSFEGREEGCGAYKADCLSCIPSGLLGILSPYPLHALLRRFSLSLSLSLFIKKGTCVFSFTGFYLFNEELRRLRTRSRRNRIPTTTGGEIGGSLKAVIRRCGCNGVQEVQRRLHLVSHLHWQGGYSLLVR